MLVAIAGDANPNRTFTPPMPDPAKAQRAAEEIGKELAARGARLLVYGGPFIEQAVVHGFVKGNPPQDRSILMWYTKEQEPPPFPEEATHPALFERRAQRGADWEIAFFRSITRADALILIGGGNATKISGQVAIGTRMPILTLAEFGGAAAQVWDTLSAGEDLPQRSEINLMAQTWTDGSASGIVTALFAQHTRRNQADTGARPILSVLAGLFFLLALSLAPGVWGRGDFNVWMLFLAPLLAGAAGSTLRPVVDRLRGTPEVALAVVQIVVLGLVAGGLAGVFFVTAQLTGDPKLVSQADLSEYARRSIPYAICVGFVAGLTCGAVFGRLMSLDVVRKTGIAAAE